jgi:hypothetical protein
MRVEAGRGGCTLRNVVCWAKQGMYPMRRLQDSGGAGRQTAVQAAKQKGEDRTSSSTWSAPMTSAGFLVRAKAAADTTAAAIRRHSGCCGALAVLAWRRVSRLLRNHQPVAPGGSRTQDRAAWLWDRSRLMTVHVPPLSSSACLFMKASTASSISLTEGPPLLLLSSTARLQQVRPVQLVGCGLECLQHPPHMPYSPTHLLSCTLCLMGVCSSDGLALAPGRADLPVAGVLIIPCNMLLIADQKLAQAPRKQDFCAGTARAEGDDVGLSLLIAVTKQPGECNCGGNGRLH